MTGRTSIALASILAYFLSCHAQGEAQPSSPKSPQQLLTSKSRIIARCLEKKTYTPQQIAELPKLAIREICRQYFLLYEEAIDPMISQCIDDDYWLSIDELCSHEIIPEQHITRLWHEGSYETIYTTKQIQNWSGMHLRNLNGLADIPQLHHIEKLDLSNNKLTALENPKEFFLLLPHLKKLILKGNFLDEENKDALIKAAPEHIKIEF
jgi:hypothetical protein